MSVQLNYSGQQINENLAAIAGKVDKITGKVLSTNDYTTAEKNKLSGIAESANNYVHPLSHPASMITEDETHRFVTDAEKAVWDAGVGSWAEEPTYIYPTDQSRFRIFKDRDDADLVIDKTKAGVGTTNYQSAIFALTNSGTGGTFWTLFSLLDDSSTDASGGTAIFGKTKQRSGALWDTAIHGEIFRQSAGTGSAGNFEMSNHNSTLGGAYGVIINYAANAELEETFYRGNAALYITGAGGTDDKKWTFGITFNATGLFGAPIVLPTQATIGTSTNGQVSFNGTDILLRAGGANYKLDKTAV